MSHLRYILPVLATLVIAIWFFNPGLGGPREARPEPVDYTTVLADIQMCELADLQIFDTANLALAERVRAHDRGGEPASDLVTRAEADDAEAMFELGVYYALISGDDASQSLAGQWLERAAKAGHAEAQNEIGVGYAAGYYGVVEDGELARDWLKQASAGGEPRAQIALADLYEQGQAEPSAEDPRSPGDIAMDLRLDAARRCYPAALRDIADALTRGRGLARDRDGGARLAQLVSDYEAEGGFVE